MSEDAVGLRPVRAEGRSATSPSLSGSRSGKSFNHTVDILKSLAYIKPHG